MKVREFVAKTLLAAVIAERGLGVLLITHRRFRPSATWLPKGLVADYSAARPFVPLFRRYHEMGHRVVAWEEEGLAEIPTDAVAEADRFLAWGDAEARRAMAANPGSGDKITVTGNPRADLLRPELVGLLKPQAAALQNRYGRYVLVNTNFSANVLYGEEELLAQIRLEYEDFTPELENYYLTRWAHSRRLFEEFQRMLPVIADRFDGLTVILRPHPSEDVEAWERALAPFPNVKVVMEGNVVNWLLGAEALVHNSCTTGIEGALLGKPVISYRPVISEVHDWDLANDVSRQVHSLDELLDTLGAILEGRAGPPPGAASAKLADHVAALDGPLASDLMADAMEAHAPVAQRMPGPAITPLMLGSSGWYDGKHTAKVALGRTKMTLAFERQKNPGWTGAEVTGLLADLRAVTGRFNDVTTAQYGRGATAFWSP